MLEKRQPDGADHCCRLFFPGGVKMIHRLIKTLLGAALALVAGAAAAVLAIALWGRGLASRRERTMNENNGT